MATPVLIDLSNYAALLKQSTAGRAGTPNGNIFFDVASGEIEIITSAELATFSYGNATGAIQINVVATAGTFTRLTGSFLTDGFRPGQSFTGSGFTNGGNNVTKVIQSVTALVITVTSNAGLVDETGGGDEVLTSAVEANPLTAALGIKFEALYAFERQERRTDEVLRKYDYYFAGTFKFGGAYNIINGRKFADSDRNKIRGSGWNERAANGNIDRIYYGNKSLGNIEATSQPYYQLSAGGAPVNYAKVGPIDEAIQVFGTTANGDTGAGDFDTRTYEALNVRTFGYNYDRKILADSGVTEMGGYSSGFALNESTHLTTGAFALADVYGGLKISPWTGMTLEKLAVAQTQGGFNEADGNFTWRLNNTANGNLNQCVAFLDALAQTDDDIDSGTETVTNGKRVNTWYTYNATGQIVTRSGADSLGLFIMNIPTADEQKIVFRDDAGNLKTRPFNVQLEIDPGAFAIADPLAWYHAFFLNGPGASDDFGTSGAITVEDSSAQPIKGNVAADHVGGKLVRSFDYDGDTIGGTAGTQKDVVFEVEGDGGATAAKTVFTITRTAIIARTCAPGLETNV